MNDATRMIEYLNELLEDDRFQWAEETLMGIQNTIEDRQYVTKGQENAIRNIVKAVERSKRTDRD